MKKNFTLLEVLLVTVIMGLIASTAMIVMENSDDQQRFDETQRRMEQIKTAIVGPEYIIYDNQLVTFGYYKDLGKFPETESPTHSAIDYLMENIDNDPDWNGPYLTSFDKDNEGNSTIYDGWGNEFEISADQDNPEEIITITSLGKNLTADGVGFDEDVSITINLNTVANSNNTGHPGGSNAALRQNLFKEIEEALIGKEIQSKVYLHGFISDTANIPVQDVDATSFENDTLIHIKSGLVNLLEKLHLQNWQYETGPDKENYGLSHGWKRPYLEDVFIQPRPLTDEFGAPLLNNSGDSIGNRYFITDSSKREIFIFRDEENGIEGDLILVSLDLEQIKEFTILNIDHTYTIDQVKIFDFINLNIDFKNDYTYRIEKELFTTPKAYTFNILNPTAVERTPDLTFKLILPSGQTKTITTEDLKDQNLEVIVPASSQVPVTLDFANDDFDVQLPEPDYNPANSDNYFRAFYFHIYEGAATEPFHRIYFYQYPNSILNFPDLTLP
ncbi:MAG: type II secretion system GspH family protein [Lentisphaerales bacterium]|nr:type II secretion system GspH family protein [Lentisphaerales bacterium]